MSAANRSAAGRKAANARWRRTAALRRTCSARLPDGTRCGAPCKYGLCKPHHALEQRQRRLDKKKKLPVERKPQPPKPKRERSAFGPRGLANIIAALTAPKDTSSP